MKWDNKQFQNAPHIFGRETLDKIEIQPDDIIIDCGANIGDITNYFQWRGARVIAFEPNKFAYEILQKRFEENTRVTCLEGGVAAPDQCGEVKLFLHENAQKDQVTYSTGSSIVQDKNNVNAEDYIMVKLIDLCKFIEGLKKPVKLLKIDIEGAEIDLLNALIDKGIAQDIPHIFAETHEEKVPSLRESTRKLKQRITDEKLFNINLNWI